MAPISYEISRPDYIWLRRGDETLYGCDQDWYTIEWRRRAGCGPVAAANILFYLRKKYDFEKIPYGNGDIGEAFAAMNDVFRFVRPKRRGLHTVKKFVNGMCKFGREYGVSFRYRYLLVRPQREFRPSLDEAARFIKDGLDCDVPVAFLNLDAGDVADQLQSWHWVTVVGLTREEAQEHANAQAAQAHANAQAAHDQAKHTPPGHEHAAHSMAVHSQKVILRYYDQSESLEVDLGKWLGSTYRGGGFAYFYNPTLRPAFDGGDIT